MEFKWFDLYLILLLHYVVFYVYFRHKKIPYKLSTIFPFSLGIIIYVIGNITISTWVSCILMVSGFLIIIYSVEYFGKRVDIRDRKPERNRKIDKILDNI